MKKTLGRVKTGIVTLLLATFVGGAVFVSGATTDNVSAAKSVGGTYANAEACSVRILTFPTWFRGLVKLDSTNTKCEIVNPNDVGGLSPFIWKIVLNVIEIGLQAVGYIAFGFILYGGFQFLTSSGDPAKAAKSRKTLIDAAVGLVISFASIAIVNLVFGII